MPITTIGQAKRLFKIVGGFTLLAAGVVMLITPGPGIVTILMGLALLAAEFTWARLLLRKIKRHGTDLRNAVGMGREPTAETPAPSNVQTAVITPPGRSARPSHGAIALQEWIRSRLHLRGWSRH